jgi:DNA invertase Pin-like site-specific DNA recombinase
MVVIGYIRVSTEGQVEDGVSLDAQREKIEAWAKLHDETEIIIYKDAGISGASMDQRPGLQDALREACKRRAALVVYSLSRLARSTRDTLSISDRLAKSGAELVSLSERIDTTSASGKMVFRLLAVLAEFERDQISERTRAAMAHMRSARRRISRFAPYGWDFDADGELLVPKISEQRIVGRMAELRAQGFSFQAIAEHLTDEAVPTKHGARQWSAKVVWTTLRRGLPLAA